MSLVIELRNVHITHLTWPHFNWTEWLWACKASQFVVAVTSQNAVGCATLLKAAPCDMVKTGHYSISKSFSATYCIPIGRNYGKLGRLRATPIRWNKAIVDSRLHLRCVTDDEYSLCENMASSARPVAYIMQAYRNAARRGLSHCHRQRALKFGEVRLCGFWVNLYKQTDRQTNGYSLQYFTPCWGRTNEVRWDEVKWSRWYWEEHS